jgi:membrane protease subunit (stomatin/prohibitin family)
MALIDVVKCDIVDGEICHKFPSENLKIGTQLVVYPSQTAVFVKGGIICDTFTAGTYTIKTENIPILNKIINLPFGGDTPFTAEVWFVSGIAKLDMPWGTPQPIQIEDPKYKIIVPVRAHGQYGLRVSNPKTFLETLVGNMQAFTTDKIDQYYKGRIITCLNSIIAQQIIEKHVSVLDINTQLMSLSNECNVLLNQQLARYGVEVVEFSIMSINVSQDDESVVRLKEAKDLAARLTITGRDVYQMERSFDVLEKAASNEGVGGQMVAMGAGLGVGVGVGNAVGNIAGNMINTNSCPPPPISQQKTYYLYINGNQIPNQTIEQIVGYIRSGMANGETLAWTAGMPQWACLSTFPEIACYLSQPTPPPVNL